MVIQFLCPNGHRIHCGKDRAGKAAKCPRCSVKFLIPAPTDGEAPAADAAESPSPSPAPLAVKTEASVAASTEPQIEFLCPAGHHLRSPASLQGQPGQCPTCGSRFYIPPHDESEPPHGEVSENSSVRVHEGRPENTPNVPSDSQVPLAMRMAETDNASSNTAMHPMASLFEQLWVQKSSGAAVELHLSGGQSVLPHHYSRRGDYGLFAMREPDGSFTLTAIAWSSVQRVTLRGLKELPDGMGGQ